MEGLVRAARAGDREALAELATRTLPSVYRLVRGVLGDRADVDDVAQECMIRMIRGLPELRDPDRFRPWLATIVHRQVSDHLRQQPPFAVTPLTEPDEFPDAGGDVAGRTVVEAALSGQRREVAEASRWLTPDDRRLLAAWWQEALGDLSRADLAGMLGVREPHLAVRLQRMRNRLDTARTIEAALGQRPGCPELAALRRTWTGERSPVWRKRFGRHVRDCARCGAHRAELLAPERLLHGLVVVAVPAALVAAVRAAVEAGAASPAHGPARRLTSGQLAVSGAAAAALALGAVIYAVYLTPDPGPAPAVAAPIASSPTPAPPLRASGSPTPTGSPAARPTSVTGVTVADIFVAPDGDDAADGSRERPFATVNRAVEVVRPGQTIALRGGVHRLSRPVEIDTDGAPDRRIVLSGYRGERAVVDASAVGDGKQAVTQRTAFWTVQDLEVRGSRSHAWTCNACRFTTFRRLSVHDNYRSGLTLRDPGTSGNQVLDSDFYRNYDPRERGSAGIGLGVKFGDGDGNVVRGNRAFHNADDGFDFGAFRSPITVESNWSYGNGQNRWNAAGWDSNGFGFSLGGGETTPSAAHRVRDNAAWDNRGDGFGAEGNTGAMSLVGNTAYHNGGDGFDLSGARGSARGNLSVGNRQRPALIGPDVTADDNSWDRGEWRESSLRSVDPTVAQGRRAADGSLPRTSYLDTGKGVGADLGD
ncbi:sigma-70 family RNA polymerase sigma factor [Micromonospora robiginosa]|uniref:Sigma-70 family RNA polymerase sigma factor n=1 Tax=Micromonospora robiginosa TaxID=2749844 RepID=A0A7L6B3H3_9ACTN|nr:sigma-70 family RNA polymerase sigma factor [Micromonospora ferruginea]QLQ36538.2 sigma-70 family RNA polymerase sigma factor [Micromonospora ferruginea]